MAKKKQEKIAKEIERSLKMIQKKPKKFNCVATEKCQINFQQQ